MRTDPRFDYQRAFSRNLGLVSEAEQLLLRNKRVAIPGCGGVGSFYAPLLARLGVGQFHIADFDTYEIENFNRQFGATMSSLGQSKVEVVRESILEINPEAEVTVFKAGINFKNIEAFLAGVDLIFDGLDFFAFEARDLLFPLAQEKGIPLITAAPLGFSSAVLIFTKHSMPYMKYFDFKKGDTRETRALKFALGLAPRLTNRPYMDPKKINLSSGKGPSSVIAISLCGSVAAAQGLNVLLNKGNPKAVPHYMQFDAHRTLLRKGYLFGGNRHPLQRLKIWFVKTFILGKRA